MRRKSASSEAAFLRGEVGVDGELLEAEQDAAAVEADDARAELLRGRTYLGRELLTWMLWRSESTDPLFTHQDTPVHVNYAGRITLRRALGEITELSAKGALAPYSAQVKRALASGLLVHTARLTFTVGGRSFEVSLDAEHLDVKSAKLPELMTEEEDDREQERLHLADELGALLDGCIRTFLTVRASRSWNTTVVPELRAWMEEDA